MVSCILLAAGFSQRFGSPKALAPLRQTTTIAHLQTTLLKTSCAEIIVVLGACAKDIHPHVFNHKRICVVYNKDYNLGQTSSVQNGWRAVSRNAHGIMLLPVDYPLIKESTIDEIIDRFHQGQPDILIPTYQQKKGHPPIFHERLTSEIMPLPVTVGLNSLFTAHPVQIIDIDDPGIIKTFNTTAEFEEIKKSR